MITSFKERRRVCISSAILLLALAVAYGCAHQAQAAVSAPKPAAMATAPPASLTQVGEYAEDIYDAAKAANWSKAATALKSLKTAESKAMGEVKVDKADKDKLNADVMALGKAITAKNRQAAMQAANSVTYTVAEMSKHYKMTTPVEVTKLDYYGRELEIWSAAKNTTRLKQTASNLKNVWQKLRPQVVSHGGKAQATKFDGLMKSLSQAKTPADYGKLATPILDQVDNIEKVFK